MLCAVSIDLDESSTPSRFAAAAVPGAGGPPDAHVIALERVDAFSRAHHLPLTIFVNGRDAEVPAQRVRLRALGERGHELGCRGLDASFLIARGSREELREQVEGGVERVTLATGYRPRGFRAPGFALSDELVEVITAAGVEFDSSVFPCPAFYAARIGSLGLAQLRSVGARGFASGAGGESLPRAASGAGGESLPRAASPFALAAPRRPYRLGRPFWRPGLGLPELPLQVTRRLRLPFMGATLTLAGPAGAGWLTQDVLGEPLVNLQLSALDLLDAEDGLGTFASRALRLRVPKERKLEALSVAVEALKKAGYAFVRLGEAADRFASRDAV
jgi:peptidoglycan/xylan/chitin deacetylase (PgdA/CDA1 family)